MPLSGITLTTNGELQLTNPENKSGSIALTVKDSQRNYKTKKLLFSKGLNAEIKLNNDSGLLTLGEPHPLQITLTNHSQEAILLSDLSMTTETKNASIIANDFTPINFAPGATSTLNQHYKLQLNQDANPDIAVLIKLTATVDDQLQNFLCGFFYLL